jgi:hypothetical protein
MNIDMRQVYIWISVIIFNSGIITLLAASYRFELEYIFRKQTIIVLFASLAVSVIPTLFAFSHNPLARYGMYILSGLYVAILLICALYYFTHRISQYGSGFIELIAGGITGALVVSWIFYAVVGWFLHK